MISSTPSFSLLIVDDHAIIRRGIRELVNKHFNISRIFEVSSRSELLDRGSTLRTDLVLLDLQFPDGNALELIPQLLRSGWGKVIVYSMSVDRVFAPLALARGASGFVNKGSSETDLIDAIACVLAGRTYLDPGMEALLKPKGRSSVGNDPFSDLSEREVDVMNALLGGASVKDIAARLDIQPTTAATYKARLFDKLGVSNVLDLQQLVQSRRS